VIIQAIPAAAPGAPTITGAAGSFGGALVSFTPRSMTGLSINGTSSRRIRATA